MSSDSENTENQSVDNVQENINSSDSNLSESKSLFDTIKNLQDEVEAQKNNYLRSVADLDNYRRRMVRERDELRKNIIYSMVEDFLPIMDNMALGIEAAKKQNASEEFLKGFELVSAQIRSIFSNYEVQELNPVGEAFNPNLHESVSLLPSDTVEENHIITVVRIGYQLKDRLLRPASVIISSGKNTKDL